MEKLEKALAAAALKIPEILLPAEKIDLGKFSVVACDQFTSQPEYWQEVEKIVGDAPSALRITLPEAYLSDNNDARIEKINSTMNDYVNTQKLKSIGATMVYLRRRTTSGVRRGLIAALDLEQYDYSKGSKSMIRATEETIIERLPPRIKIRENAPLEAPHIMVLIDDKSDKLMSLLDSACGNIEKLYDFELMQNGGHSTGYRVDSPELLQKIADILIELKQQSADGLLYAMGDGNHSLATAKACWEKLKPTLTESQRENHPARWALAEIVNLYDPALKFEPIHRLLFNVDPEAVQRDLGFDAKNPPDAQILQPKLDAWLKNHPEAQLDYIHGENECHELGNAPDRLAIVFSEFDRDSLFDVVIKNGSFVRKSFSMGTAVDKRYYLECRAIK